MNRVLLVGENPDGFSGNGLMMRGVISQLVNSENITLFCPFTNTPPSLLNKSYSIIPSDDINFRDIWGTQKLVSLIHSFDFDFIMF